MIEYEVIEKMQSMCEESLIPELFEYWDEIKNQLMHTRKNLKPFANMGNAKQYDIIETVKAVPMTAEKAEVLLARDLNTKNAERTLIKRGDEEIYSEFKEGIYTVFEGYLVTFPNGYEDWYPKKQFEKMCTVGNKKTRKLPRRLANNRWSYYE